LHFHGHQPVAGALARVKGEPEANQG